MTDGFRFAKWTANMIIYESVTKVIDDAIKLNTINEKAFDGIKIRIGSFVIRSIIGGAIWQRTDARFTQFAETWTRVQDEYDKVKDEEHPVVDGDAIVVEEEEPPTPPEEPTVRGADYVPPPTPPTPGV